MADHELSFNESDCDDGGGDPPIQPLPLQRPLSPAILRTGDASSSRPTIDAPIGPVLGEPMVQIESLYTYAPDLVLQKGRFAAISAALDMQTGKMCACKRIDKGVHSTPSALERIRREVKILHYLTGIPHIIRFHRAYEDDSFVYLFMEYCYGGNLYTKVIREGRLPEWQALRIFAEIIRAVHSCHSMGVAHRDLKPENVVLVDQSLATSIKLVDFGLSRFLEDDPSRKYWHRVGTLDYAAPEVLKKCFGKEADVWSAGVILYFCLSGELPFTADKREDLPKIILKSKVDLKKHPWPSVSNLAKDLIKRLLQKNPKQRITTDEILGHHPWLRGMGTPIPMHTPHVFEFFWRLRQIKQMKRLTKLGHMIMAIEVCSDHLSRYKEIFVEMGSNEFGGGISLDEFLNKLYIIGSRASEHEIDIALDQQNREMRGSIEFMEMITAMVPIKDVQDQKILENTFRKLHYSAGWYVSRDRVECFWDIYRFPQGREAVKEAYCELDLRPDENIPIEKFVKCIMRVKVPADWTSLKTMVQCSMS